MAPKIFRNRRIFGNFNVSSENLCTFTAGNDKGFESYRKIFELGLPYSTGTTMPLSSPSVNNQ